jgi:hypothetical protein
VVCVRDISSRSCNLTVKTIAVCPDVAQCSPRYTSERCAVGCAHVGGKMTAVHRAETELVVMAGRSLLCSTSSIIVVAAAAAAAARILFKIPVPLPGCSYLPTP